MNFVVNILMMNNTRKIGKDTYKVWTRLYTLVRIRFSSFEKKLSGWVTWISQKMSKWKMTKRKREDKYDTSKLHDFHEKVTEKKFRQLSQSQPLLNGLTYCLQNNFGSQKKSLANIHIFHLWKSKNLKSQNILRKTFSWCNNIVVFSRRISNY